MKDRRQYIDGNMNCGRFEYIIHSRALTISKRINRGSLLQIALEIVWLSVPVFYPL